MSPGQASTHGTSGLCPLSASSNSRVFLTSSLRWVTKLKQKPLQSCDNGFRRPTSNFGRVHLIVQSRLQNSLSGGFDAERLSGKAQVLLDRRRGQS